LHEQLGQVIDAVKCAERWLIVEPGNAEASSILNRLGPSPAIANDRTEHAKSADVKVCQEGVDATAQAFWYAERGNIKEAIISFEHADETSKVDAKTYCQSGLIMFEHGYLVLLCYKSEMTWRVDW